MLESFQNNKFTYQRLTEEEQQKRGILGRLVGIIADTTRPTRNGRRYTEELWNKVFDSDLMKEKIENRCCFGELDHPADREEICSEKIAICLAERPKVGEDGNLYGVFDILNTPCGKILKALCDYGCNIGVSSRGSGDLYTDEDGNESVDPDTYECEGWDAVIIPSVKAARPKFVTESLQKQKSLKQALTESYNNASVEDRKIMKETLNNLNLSLTEAEGDLLPGGTPKDDSQIPQALVEEADIDDIKDDDEDDSDDKDEDKEEKDDKKSKKDDKDKDDKKSSDKDKDDSDADSEDNDINTVKDLTKSLKSLIKNLEEYDDDTKVGFEQININGQLADFTEISFDEKDGMIDINIGFTPLNDGSNIEDADQVDDQLVATEDAISDDTIDAEGAGEIIDQPDSTEAVDDGMDEVIESLKGTVRQKDLLEKEVKQLKADKAVGDAKVKELQESVNKYKTSFERVSKIAANAKSLESANKELKEQLSAKTTELRKLVEAKNQEKVSAAKLNESLNENSTKIKTLSEALKSAKDTLNEKDNKMAKITEQYRESLIAKNKLVEDYKAKNQKILNSYILSKANMLGVRPSEIIDRLNESFEIEDVDKVCDDLLDYNVNMSKLPIGLNKNSRIRVAESVQKPKVNEYSNPDNGYEIDDSLLELAGLKK